jgi:hypothetical protein
MFSLLFHKDVFMPNGVNAVVATCQKNFKDYHLTSHLVMDNILNSRDRSHDYTEEEIHRCIETIGNGEPLEAFEVELSKDYRYFGQSGWFVTKYCIRVPLSSTEDLAIVIRPQYNNEGKIQSNNNKVVTAWINARDDAHYTLDGSKYTSKENWVLANKKRR